MNTIIAAPLNPSSSRIPADVLFVALVTLLGLVSGAIVGLGFTLLNVLIIGGLTGLFLLAIPTRHMLWGLVVLVFLVVGQVLYFGRLNQILWVPYGIGVLLYFKLPGLLAEHGRFSGEASTPLVWPVAAFILAVLLSIIVNAPPPLQAVAGGKNLLALWSVFLVVALGAVSLMSIASIWRFFFFVAAFQVPLLAYQYVVVAPSRTAFGSTVGARWDSMVGGFGGDPMGGGASGSMALFLCVVFFFGIALYRRFLLKLRWLLLLIVTVMGCIGLAEVKVVAVLIPVGLTVVFWSTLRSRPVLALSVVPLTILSVVGILVAYDRLHYESGGRRASGPVEVVQKAFSYSLDPNHINFRTREMGRMAALTHWWKENISVDPVRSLVGHGPGASRGQSIFGIGEVARKYPFFIDRSAATQLLWDVGLLGLAAFCIVLMRGVFVALKASRAEGCSPEVSASLEATAAGLVMMLAMLPYGRDLLEVPAMGVLMMLFLGYATLAYRLHRTAPGGGAVAVGSAPV